MPIAPVKELIAVSQGFAGGVDTKHAINEIPPNCARFLENIILNEMGGASARLGTEAEGSADPGDVTIGTYVYYREGHNPQLTLNVVAGGFGRIYGMDVDSDGHTTAAVPVLIQTALSHTEPFSFETYNGILYFSNNIDGLFSWNGTISVSIAAAPKGRYIRIWKDALWVSGIDGLASRVYESAAGDPTTWPVANWVDITKGDGDVTTGLGNDGTYLIAFKRFKYSAISDPVTFANHVVDYDKGCEDHRTVRMFEGSMYFISRRGVCRYDGADTPALIISENVEPLFDPRILSYSLMKYAQAYTMGQRIGWCLFEEGQNPTILGGNTRTLQLEYYPRLGRLNTYGIRAIGPFAFMRWPVFNICTVYIGDAEVYHGGNANGGTSRVAAPTSYDVHPGALTHQSYDCTIQTGAYDFGSSMLDKYLRHMQILGRGKVGCTIRTDFGTAIDKALSFDLDVTDDLWSIADLWGVGLWGPTELYQLARDDPDAYGKFFTFEFHTTIQPGSALGSKKVPVGSVEYSVDEGDMGIYGFHLEAVLLGVRS